MLHPTASIEEGVIIGSGTAVWARTHIRGGARIGTGCTIGADVYVGAGVRVGDRCKVQNQALLYEGAVLEDCVFVGPAACLTNDRFPRAATPDGQLKRPEDWLQEGVLLEHGCSIGAHAVVLAGVRIGRYAMVGSGAVVTHDVPAFSLAVANPARVIGRVCVCGHRLAGGRCGRCGALYAETDAGLVEARAT